MRLLGSRRLPPPPVPALKTIWPRCALSFECVSEESLIRLLSNCYLRGRWTQSNVVPSSDNRYLFYVEHIEAVFGYKVDEDATPNPNVPPHESATIYIGPDDEWVLGNMRLWRKSGGSTVVWNQDAKLRLGNPRLV